MRLAAKQMGKISLSFAEQFVIPSRTLWLEPGAVILPSPQALDTGFVRANTISSRQQQLIVQPLRQFFCCRHVEYAPSVPKGLDRRTAMSVAVLFHLREQQTRSTRITHQLIEQIVALMHDLSPFAAAKRFVDQRADGVCRLIAFPQATVERFFEDLAPNPRYRDFDCCGRGKGHVIRCIGRNSYRRSLLSTDRRRVASFCWSFDVLYFSNSENFRKTIIQPRSRLLSCSVERAAHDVRNGG